jgi:hypothetical protein
LPLYTENGCRFNGGYLLEDLVVSMSGLKSAWLFFCRMHVVCDACTAIMFLHTQTKDSFYQKMRWCVIRTEIGESGSYADRSKHS